MLLGLKGYAGSLQGSQRLKVDSIQTLVAPKDAKFQAFGGLRRPTVRL